MKESTNPTQIAGSHPGRLRASDALQKPATLLLILVIMTGAVPVITIGTLLATPLPMAI